MPHSGSHGNWTEAVCLHVTVDTFNKRRQTLKLLCDWGWGWGWGWWWGWQTQSPSDGFIRGNSLTSVRYSHRAACEAGVHVLLEVRVLGGQVGEVRGSVFVAVPRVHGLIQSHVHRAEDRTEDTRHDVRVWIENYRDITKQLDLKNTDITYPPTTGCWCQVMLRYVEEGNKYLISPTWESKLTD